MGAVGSGAFSRSQIVGAPAHIGMGAAPAPAPIAVGHTGGGLKLPKAAGRQRGKCAGAAGGVFFAVLKSLKYSQRAGARANFTAGIPNRRAQEYRKNRRSERKGQGGATQMPGAAAAVAPGPSIAPEDMLRAQ